MWDQAVARPVYYPLHCHEFRQMLKNSLQNVKDMTLDFYSLFFFMENASKLEAYHQSSLKQVHSSDQVQVEAVSIVLHLPAQLWHQVIGHMALPERLALYGCMISMIRETVYSVPCSQKWRNSLS